MEESIHQSLLLAAARYCTVAHAAEDALGSAENLQGLVQFVNKLFQNKYGSNSFEYSHGARMLHGTTNRRIGRAYSKSTSSILLLIVFGSYGMRNSVGTAKRFGCIGSHTDFQPIFTEMPDTVTTEFRFEISLT